MDQSRILEAVSERDIDLVILEELGVNQSFLEWWIGEAGAEPYDNSGHIDVQHSVTHPQLGESDIVIVYGAPDSESHALLIENKISAPPQPAQAARYRQRGDIGVSGGTWKSYCTCILAPQEYQDATSDSQLYDARISYEQVRDWLLAHDSDPRAVFRARILDEAIEQNHRGYTPEADERVTEYWHRYWECASQEFPEFGLREPGPKPAKADWIEIQPDMLPSGRRIYHKLSKGFVDFQIDGAAGQIEAIRSDLSALLGSDTDVVVTGKSASVRVVVPSLDSFAAFEDQQEAARAGMKAALRLIYISRAISAA